MEVILIVVIAVLIIVSIILNKKHKKAQQEIATLKEVYNEEVSAAAEKYHKEMEIVSKSHEENVLKINRINDSKVEELNKVIFELQSFSRNTGEIITHQILMNIKQNFLNKGLIQEDEFIIIPNIFIPFEKGDSLKTRQIDHLILMPTGIYIIETKYWNGKVVYGLNSKNAGSFSFIPRMMGNKTDEEDTYVFIAQNNTEVDGNITTTISVRNYGNPARQVKYTAVTLKKFLDNKLNNNHYVTPILYFGYQGKNKDLEFMNRSKEKSNIIVLNEQEQLEQYLNGELTSERKRYSADQMRSIVDELKNIGY